MKLGDIHNCEKCKTRDKCEIQPTMEKLKDKDLSDEGLTDELWEATKGLVKGYLDSSDRTYKQLSSTGQIRFGWKLWRRTSRGCNSW